MLGRTKAKTLELKTDSQGLWGRITINPGAVSYTHLDVYKRQLHDLCGTALYGTYGDVDIAITHAFFPIVAAHQKADEDNIPLFGWQDDGWLTMTNTPVTDHQEIVRWFIKMRERGFNIKQVGFDRKFGREFFLEMRRARFRIEDTPQLYHFKSEGFRRIETDVYKRQL